MVRKQSGAIDPESLDDTGQLDGRRRPNSASFDPNSQVKDPMQSPVDVRWRKSESWHPYRASIVLGFWATWRIPCRAHTRLYDQVRRNTRIRTTSFFSVDTDEDKSMCEASISRRYWGQNHLLRAGWPAASVSDIPTTIVFGKKGDVNQRMIGFLPTDSWICVGGIDEALGINRRQPNR